MKVRPSVLMPLFRSDGQGRLLAAIYAAPDHERTITALAHRAVLSVPTASREVERLANAGLVAVRTSGRNRYVRADRAHPLFDAVQQLALYSYGPIEVLAPLLARVSGIDEAYIYGSWAARLAGERGPDPEDLDVLVIGSDVVLGDLDDATEEARKRLGREVNARVVSADAWAAREDPFLAFIHSRPLIELPVRDDEEHDSAR